MPFDKICCELTHLYGRTRAGASGAAIDAFQTRYAVRLPDDMRKAYLLMDGADDSTNPNESWMRFWPVEEIVPAREELPSTKAVRDADGLFVIADYAIECVYYVIQLRPSEPTFGHVYAIGATRAPEIAASFSEFVQLVIVDSGQLHSYS